MNTETILVIVFVAIVFGSFYVISRKAEKHVKTQYEEKRRAEEARAAARGTAKGAKR